MFEPVLVLERIIKEELRGELLQGVASRRKMDQQLHFAQLLEAVLTARVSLQPKKQQQQLKPHPLPPIQLRTLEARQSWLQTQPKTLGETSV